MPAVRVIDLHYAYPPLVTGEPPIRVLQGLDLEIARGEFVSVMGPTGAGKTTLCLTLNGIIPHSVGGLFRGEVWVDGLNTKDCDVPTLASRVGLVFQDPESQFFTMTVEDEVAFGPESLGADRHEIARRIEWALDLVDMHAYRHRSPFQLSGGQKQRVAIASILAMHPRILVLDEPTSGLDPIGKDEVFRVVHGLKRQEGITIVMVEQDAERIAEFSDRILVLQDGRIATEGSPREVFAQTTAMDAAGLAIPQVTELAGLHNRTWGTHYDFVAIDEAHEALCHELTTSHCDTDEPS